MRAVGRGLMRARAPRSRLGTHWGARPTAWSRALRGLVAVVTLAGGAWLWPVSLGGDAAIVTTYGISMEPMFQAGDLAVVHTATDYHVGDVVAYHNTELKAVVLHRIVARDGARFVFKGDNNEFQDPEHPVASQFLGELVLRVPQGGAWLQRIASPVGLAVLTFVLLMAAGTRIRTTHRRRRGAMSQRAASAPPGPRTTQAAADSPAADSPTANAPAANSPSGSSPAKNSLATAAPAVQAIATATILIGILGVVLAGLAWTGPVTLPAVVDASVDRSMTFSYSAAVGRTPAYDSTTASSPDPVFRNLAQIVDVHLAYLGAPGTMSVDAELSAPSGWRSTVPLAALATVDGPRHDATVHLDLTALDAQAQAAAAVTGLPTPSLTVTVAPRVTTADGAPFTPRLALTLSPLVLSLVGDAKALTVTDSTPVRRTTAEPRTIGALGRQISVTAARLLSSILLLAALLAAAALVLVVRRTAPTSEGAGINRQYGPLLVTVDPMPMPTARPVVDVGEFSTLARLAERYGLLVLHWSSEGSDTFVVRDDDTTYRYRTAAMQHHGQHSARAVARRRFRSTAPRAHTSRR